VKIGAPKEIFPGENRVAMTPESAAQLKKLGHSCLIESGAGAAAGFDDAAYAAAGVDGLPMPPRSGRRRCGGQGARAATAEELGGLREGQTLISFFWPAQNTDLLEAAAARGATVIAMDMVPRISRAQKMDALSSMANIAGYRAVIEAGNNFGRFFTGQVTAAGKVPPAKVLVVGAGVAGLPPSAPRSLGAITYGLRRAPRSGRTDRIDGRRIRLPRIRGDAGRRRHRRLCRALQSPNSAKSSSPSSANWPPRSTSSSPPP
jgi:H+-translocating NAD(P) transhydrogenase subunit alpha